MTPESPRQPNPEKEEERLSRRDFLVGAAALAAGFAPEQVEAAPTVETFSAFLENVEGAKEHREEITEHYRESSEAHRHLIYGQFRCYHGERPVITEYRSPGDFNVECR